jgi:hypothetical protein
MAAVDLVTVAPGAEGWRTGLDEDWEERKRGWRGNDAVFKDVCSPFGFWL